MSLELEDDRWCYACGPLNPSGFKLRFAHPQPGQLRARVTFKKEHQGYKNIVHGGLIGTLLDEMMVNLAWVEGTPAVTGSYTVRLIKPIRVGAEVQLEGRIDRKTPRLIYASATARGTDGQLLAEAEATCVRIKNAPQLGPEIIEESGQKS